jgi:phosphoribosylaminoimidazole-succinocarboxamide synthase
MVVRAYVTGVTSTSIWTALRSAASASSAGTPSPTASSKNERLPAPILTPSTKAAQGGHDVLGLARGDPRDGSDRGASLRRRRGARARALRGRASEICADARLILVDTKYELGKTRGGKVVVIDEIHTPDSSRFWFAAHYGERFAQGEEPESFDKEYVRRWLAGVGFKGDGPMPARSRTRSRIEAAAGAAEAKPGAAVSCASAGA